MTSGALNTDRAKPLHILLVDDHADTLLLLERVLRREKYNVTVTQTYAEALQLGRSRDIDVLVSDIRLPGGSGWQLLTELKQANPNLVGVAASGTTSAEDLARSQEAGFCVHLTKPIDFDKLRDVIEQCVADQAA